MPIRAEGWRGLWRWLMEIRQGQGPADLRDMAPREVTPPKRVNPPPRVERLVMAVDVDRPPPAHFATAGAVTDEAVVADQIAYDAAVGIGPVLRNRIVPGGDVDQVAVRLIETGNDYVYDDYDEAVIGEVVDAVIAAQFPRVVANEDDLTYAILIAITLHYALRLAGLPAAQNKGQAEWFTERLAEVLTTVQKGAI